MNGRQPTQQSDLRRKKACLDSCKKVIVTLQEILILIGLDCPDPQAEK